MTGGVRFELGSFGWEHAQWAGGFYPDDLPEDWRLTYYANEFGCVLVPQDQWLSADEDQWAGWEDDPVDSFRFFLEVDSGRFAETEYRTRLQACIGILGGKCAALVDRAGEAFERAAPGDARLLRAVQVDEARGGLSDGIALLLNDAGLGSLRDQRALLESLAAEWVGGGNVPLFLVGDPPRPEALRKLKQLAELLEVA